MNKSYKHIALTVLFTLLWVISIPSLVAQNKQGNIWYFGEHAGLDFNTSPPSPLLDGQLNTYEGCTSIADKDGNLLFYSDGVTVYNKNHEVMENGSGLAGDPSGSQSGVIVPHPSTQDLYYIFTVGMPQDPFSFSIVDMSINNGLGKVTVKNTRLLFSATEKVTAVQKSDGSGFWIISYASDYNKIGYYIFNLNEDGLNETPVYFPVEREGFDRGYIKISPYGDILAAAFQQRGNFESYIQLFRFDDRKGEVQESIFLSIFPRDSRYKGGDGPYGIEFSPNGKFLYVSERTPYNVTPNGTFNRILQYDISVLENDVIEASRIVLDSIVSKQVGGLQLGPDGKIYLAIHDSDSLGVINFPDKKGAAAGYKRNGIYLGGRKSQQGLPTFNQSLFRQMEIEFDNECFNDATSFTFLSNTENIENVVWDFGDPTSASNSAAGTVAAHQFSSSGEFSVSASVTFDGQTRTITRPVTINPSPDLSLGTDSIYTSELTRHYNLNTNNQTYLWNDGSTEPSKTVSSPGWHWVEATTEQGCIKRDSLALFKVNYADTCMLSNTSFELLSGNIQVDSVSWQVDDNLLKGEAVNNVFSSSGTKNITANIYYNKTSLTQDFQIEIPALPNVDLGNDKTLFYGETLDLDVSSSGTSFSWQDDSTSPTFTVDSPGTYWVDVTNASGCTQRDSLVITYDQIIDVALPNDATLCLGESLDLDVSLPEASYLWQDGSTSPDFTVSQEGTYWVEITNAFGNRTKIYSITVDYYEFNEMEVEAEMVICEASDVALSVTGGRGNESYLWYDENMSLLEENQGQFTTSMLNTSTDFFVTTTNGACESDPVRISVIYDEVFAEITASDTITKLGEPIELFGFGGDYFEWSPPIWLSDPNTQNPVTNPEDDIEYTLTVTSARGCTDSETILLLVEKRINIPNVITPNGDGLNDFWEIQFIDRFPGSKVQIFDRSGSLLFEEVNYRNDWSGTEKGQELPTGTYFYKIDLNDPEFPIEKGSLTILRKNNE